MATQYTQSYHLKDILNLMITGFLKRKKLQLSVVLKDNGPLKRLLMVAFDENGKDICHVICPANVFSIQYFNMNNLQEPC